MLEVYMKAKKQSRIFRRMLFLIVIACLTMGGVIDYVFVQFSSIGWYGQRH
jgi:hypothetical protein